MRGIKKLLGLATLAIPLAFGSADNARAVGFDPDGAGPLGAIDAGTLDWGPTSFLAQGGVSAIQAATIAAGSPGGIAGCGAACEFTVLVQATLIGTLNPGGGVNTPSGLGQNFEITMVASLRERVSGLIPGAGGTGLAQFQTVNNASNFLNVFFDSTVNANQLTGAGFNDGRLILSGTQVGSASGNFEVTSATPVALDQHGANDLTGQNTVTGNGSQGNIPLNNLLFDPTFFLGGLTSLGINFAQISQGLPFISVDPMVCFDPSATGVAIGSTAASATQNCFGQVVANAPYSGQAPATVAGVIPSTGATNGLFANGPDFVAQTDFNSPLAGVPEPASFLLFGFGLMGMGGYLRKRNKKAE
jgi:hypothetical protein